MYFEEGEPLTDRERRYQEIRHKRFDYTDEKEDKGKTPLFGGMKGKEFSRLLLQTIHELKREIKGMRRERHEDPSRIFSHEESPNSSYYVCEHSATQSNLQRYTMPRFTAREIEEEDAPKEETLSDYL